MSKTTVSTAGLSVGQRVAQLDGPVEARPAPGFTGPFPQLLCIHGVGSTLPADQVQALIDKADDPVFVQDAFRQALAERRRTGSTLAALLLEELQVYAADISAAKVGSLVSTLFAIADELDVVSDELHGFRIGDNPLQSPTPQLVAQQPCARAVPTSRTRADIWNCNGDSEPWLVLPLCRAMRRIFQTARGWPRPW